MEKRDIIVAACRREIKARQDDTVDTAALVAKLTACGVSKAKARRLAAAYDPDQSPYQFFYRGGLTFLQAKRAAKLIDPKRASEDRAFLFVVDQFIPSQHIIVSQRDIRKVVWNDFGVEWSRTDDATARLVDLGVIRKIERKGTAPAVMTVDAIISTEAFGSGVIVSVTQKPAIGQCAVVKFDDGTRRTMQSVYLHTETTIALFGLSRLVEAEEAIANILSHNAPIELSP